MIKHVANSRLCNLAFIGTAVAPACQGREYRYIVGILHGDGDAVPGHEASSQQPPASRATRSPYFDRMKIVRAPVRSQDGRQNGGQISQESG